MQVLVSTWIKRQKRNQVFFFFLSCVLALNATHTLTSVFSLEMNVLLCLLHPQSVSEGSFLHLSDINARCKAGEDGCQLARAPFIISQRSSKVVLATTRIYAQSAAFVWRNGMDVSGYDKSGHFVLVMSFGARVWTYGIWSCSTEVQHIHLLTPPWFLVWLMSYMKSLIRGSLQLNCSLPPGGDRDVSASTRVDFIFTDACITVCICFSSKNEQKYVKNKVWPTPQTQSRKWLGITGKKSAEHFSEIRVFLNLVKQMAISSAAQMLILLYNKQIYWRAKSWNRCDGAKHSAPLELLQLDVAILAKSFIGSGECGTK